MLSSPYSWPAILPSLSRTNGKSASTRSNWVRALHSTEWLYRPRQKVENLQWAAVVSRSDLRLASSAAVCRWGTPWFTALTTSSPPPSPPSTAVTGSLHSYIVTVPALAGTAAPWKVMSQMESPARQSSW